MRDGPATCTLAALGLPRLLVALLVAHAAPARGDELRVLAAGATESTLLDVVASFEARSGHTVKIVFGAVGLLRDRVLAGEPADLVIVTPAIIEQLEARALVRPGSRVDVGSVGGGIAVRLGERAPPVGSPEELRQALLAADEIYFADPATATAGAHLLAVADRLGVGEAVRRKGHVAPGGKEAMRLMTLSRAAAIGLTQISEILSVDGVVLVAPYPAPLQRTTTYAGVVLASAAHPDAASAFQRFLASGAVLERLRKAGFDPPGR
jgi:molybdate transport system substrate-binding protein